MLFLHSESCDNLARDSLVTECIHPLILNSNSILLSPKCQSLNSKLNLLTVLLMRFQTSVEAASHLYSITQQYKLEDVLPNISPKIWVLFLITDLESSLSELCRNLARRQCFNGFLTRNVAMVSN